MCLATVCYSLIRHEYVGTTIDASQSPQETEPVEGKVSWTPGIVSPTRSDKNESQKLFQGQVKGVNQAH